MGESRGGSSAVSSGNAVGNELYRETAGNRGKVGHTNADQIGRAFV